MTNIEKYLHGCIVLLSSSLLAYGQTSIPTAALDIDNPRVVYLDTLKESDWVNNPPGSPVFVYVIEGDPYSKTPVPYTEFVRFPAGLMLGPHCHPDVERTTLLRGELTISVGKDTKHPVFTRRLTPGAVSLMPKNILHFGTVGPQGAIIQVHGISPWHFYRAGIDPEAANCR